MSKFQAAVIGLGGMGCRHLQAVQKIGMEVVSICDQNGKVIPAALELVHTAPQIYSSWEKLLECESEKIDLLIVATNGPSHAAITQRAAKSGIPHILCEKPMATSGQQAREMARVCKESDTRLAINLARRFMDRFIRLKEILKTGIIGEIHHANVVVGAGGLGCIGTHYFDLISWLADTKATWVVGNVDSDPAPNVRGEGFFDPGGRGMVGYRNGMTASFELSGDVPVMGGMVQLTGTQGFVEFDGWRPPTGGQVAIFARPQEQQDTLKTRFVPPERVGFELGEALDVVLASKICLEDLVSQHREDTVSGGIAAVDTVMAFHLSAQRNWQKIDLPLREDDLLFDIPIT